MKNKILKTLAIVASATLLLLMSCKTTQQQQQVTTKETVPAIDTIALAKTYHQSITSMSAQYKMQLFGNQLLSVSGTIESITDKELMLTAKALLGIEVLRIYCTPTRAILIDRLGRRVCDMPFEQLEPELGTDFYGLQGIITNRLFDPGHNNYADFTLDVIDGNWLLTHNGKYQTEFLIQGGSFLQRTIIRSIEKGDYVMATYSAPTSHNGWLYPSKVQGVYHSKERNNSVDVTLQNISFNQLNTVNFEVPTGYKTVTVDELKKQLLSL